MNAWIEQYLRPWTSGKPKAWSQLLLVAEFAHNSWKHDIAKCSPHELLIGIKPQVILKHLESSTPAAKTCLKLLDQAHYSLGSLITVTPNVNQQMSQSFDLLKTFWIWPMLSELNQDRHQILSTFLR